jgi:hypothetical protein
MTLANMRTNGVHTNAAPQDRPRFWTITARLPQSYYDRGYAATREAAMIVFKLACDPIPDDRIVTSITVALSV